jgi:hypothetical protein
MDALRVGWLSQTACGVGLRREIYTNTHKNILAPLVVEMSTSATKDLEHLVVHRNVLSASSERRCLLMLPVEPFKLWARLHEPEKGAEGNSVRTIQVIIVRTIFGAVRDIEVFQRRCLSRDHVI